MRDLYTVLCHNVLYAIGVLVICYVVPVCRLISALQCLTLGSYMKKLCAHYRCFGCCCWWWLCWWWHSTLIVWQILILHDCINSFYRSIKSYVSSIWAAWCVYVRVSRVPFIKKENIQNYAFITSKTHTLTARHDLFNVFFFV